MSQQNPVINFVLKQVGGVILLEHIPVAGAPSIPGVSRCPGLCPPWPHGGRAPNAPNAPPAALEPIYPARMGKAVTGDTAIVLTAPAVSHLPVLYRGTQNPAGIGRCRDALTEGRAGWRLELCERNVILNTPQATDHALNWSKDTIKPLPLGPVQFVAPRMGC